MLGKFGACEAIGEHTARIGNKSFLSVRPKNALSVEPKRFWFFFLKCADIDCSARAPWPFLRYPILSLLIPFELHFRVEIIHLAGPNFLIGEPFHHPTHGVRVGVRAGIGDGVEKGPWKLSHFGKLFGIERPTVCPPISLEGLHHSGDALAVRSEGIPEFLHGITLFLQGLKDYGLTEGENLGIEFRWADGQYDRLPVWAADLVQLRVAVIAVASTIATIAAKQATQTIPIVFFQGGDPIKLGFVSSLHRPGGNITGASFLTDELVQKRFEVLHELLPNATVIGLLVNPSFSTTAEAATNAQAAAALFGIKVVLAEAVAEGDFEPAFAALVQQGAQALLVAPDPYFNSRAATLVALLRRREFITLLGGAAAAVASPLGARGQQGRKVPRIGVLWPTSSEAEEEPFIRSLRIGLQELGYVESRTIALENRFASRLYDRFGSLAAELVALPVDLLIAVTLPAALAVQKATTSIPVIFILVHDPVETKLVDSFARPGGLITGFSHMSLNLTAKRLELFKELIDGWPFAFLVNPANEQFARLAKEEMRAAAASLGLDFQLIETRVSDELDGTL